MKRIFTERLTEYEKELLELFRTLKSDKLQNMFIGQAEISIPRLIAYETERNSKTTEVKPNLQLVKK